MIKLGDRWKTQVIGGEITWNWGDLRKFKNFAEVIADGEYRTRTLEQIRNLHCNHLGGITWSDFTNAEFLRNASLLQKALGYRFVLSEFQYPETVTVNTPFNISFRVTNQGSSPFYYNWPVELSFLDSQTREKVWSTILTNVNISEWMPGDNWDIYLNQYLIPPSVYTINTQVQLNTPLPKGEYIISLAVLDPAGMQPSLRFANKNYFRGGYHPLGYIGVNTKPRTCFLDNTTFDDIQSDTTLKYKIIKEYE
jgi:hypothetical protein